MQCRNSQICKIIEIPNPDKIKLSFINFEIILFYFIRGSYYMHTIMPSFKFRLPPSLLH